MHSTNMNDHIEDCPISKVQKVLQGKWTLVIIFFLSEKTLRFGELSRRIPQVTQANLTKELRRLEEYGLIHREVYKEVPPKVEYSLTQIGVQFIPVLKNIEQWAVMYDKYTKKK